MRYLRTLSTPRLTVVIVAVAVVAAGSAALAVAASGGGGQTPPAKPLAQAIHDALGGSAPSGIHAEIRFTNNLFPTGSLTGAVGSALLSGATGRLWATDDGRGRLELQSSAGDVQIVWNTNRVTAYDASSNTAYELTLPQSASTSGSAHTSGVPSVDEISKFLTEVAGEATVSDAQPDNVGNQPAYTVTVSPKHDGGLLGSAQLAFDAARGVPLRVAIYAQGSSTPALALQATDIGYGTVAASTVDVAPPAGAKIVDLGSTAKGAAGGTDQNPTPDPTGVAGVQADVPFTLAAPDTLVGLPRQHVGLLGKDAALVIYGKGLGAIAVLERPADTSKAGGAMSGIPTVSLDGVSAHELATELGTVLEWQNGGRSTVLAGSLPPAAAEAAARELK